MRGARLPADRAPDRPTSHAAMQVGKNGVAYRWLTNIRTPAPDERALARRYLQRRAPDLLAILGLEDATCPPSPWRPRPPG